jgi:hypothetical protein
MQVRQNPQDCGEQQDERRDGYRADGLTSALR